MFGNVVYHLVLFYDQTNGSRFLVSRYWDARTIRQFLVCILQSSCYRSYFSFTDHTPINFHNLKPVNSINKRHKTNKKVFKDCHITQNVEFHLFLFCFGITIFPDCKGEICVCTGLSSPIVPVVHTWRSMIWLKIISYWSFKILRLRKIWGNLISCMEFRQADSSFF